VKETNKLDRKAISEKGGTEIKYSRDKGNEINRVHKF
jgi:hypothetical protein